MINDIPVYVLDVSRKLSSSGFENFIVGGSVRDMLLRLPLKDWDLATNATPEEILKIFPDGYYDNSFGTVGVPIEYGDKKEVMEITTYRTEEGYSDNRRPDKISWGTSIEEDLKRRDFTINAVALKIAQGSSGDSFTIVDPYDGQKDILEKLIRSVGNPDERFKEDALRLMRAVRLSAQLSFQIENETLKSVSKKCSSDKKYFE